MSRNFPPLAVPIWMQKLKNGAYISKQGLERCLLPFMKEGEATQAVDNAMKLGILVPKAKGNGNRILLCFSQKVTKPLTKDPYCFECHLSGTTRLKKCAACVRSFHVACQRKDPHRPNYAVPSDRGQPHQFPLNESDVEQAIAQEDSEESDNETPMPEPAVLIEPPPQIEVDYNCNISSMSRQSLKHEDYSDNDVYFVSEQPARKRRRASSYIKNEDVHSNESSDELDHCTPCRLLKLPSLLNPPHVTTDELNCLLGYSWQKHQSWLKKDVRKHISKHWGEHDATLVKSVLFTNDVLGLSDIAQSIQTHKFKQLCELLIDLLDLQHNIGVFFGTKCEIYNATKWLLRDITHDIREIRRCSDCYRYSNEANRSTLWFAKPCTQRHELVYAKQQGSPYWPAKVIRVMTKNCNIYDVRFFGGSHGRALLSHRKIRPIDADLSALNQKLKNSRALHMALRELHCHKMLLHQPMYLFNFYADPQEAQMLIDRTLSHYMDIARPATPALSRKRKATTAIARVQPSRRCSTATRPEAFSEINSSTTSSSPTFENSTQMAHNELVQEVFILNSQLNRVNNELTAVKQDLNAVKRQRWCQHCLKSAKFDCCFAASYCSQECQRLNKRLHQGSCHLKGRRAIQNRL
ncbi:CG8569 [Drosophila busckii]|uniref:CG8569 n=1 Tax=Drosophila busckii TaxID=30019 RepID=A0A0M4EUZ7_DROBS|nr:uncharacterized protein LOC108594746 [Drosophila busckii]ALC41357.1 CG8569 [Drosophila busckii]